jgi:hypothetical protein
MRIRIADNLPIIAATLEDGGIRLRFDKVLLDTGSVGTLFPFDILRDKGIQPPSNARIREMTGIGESVESVVEFRVESLAVGELHVANFVIQAGNIDYGYEFDAILGFDFLLEVGAMVDFDRMEMRPSTKP